MPMMCSHTRQHTHTHTALKKKRNNRMRLWRRHNSNSGGRINRKRVKKNKINNSDGVALHNEKTKEKKINSCRFHWCAKCWKRKFGLFTILYWPIVNISVLNFKIHTDFVFTTKKHDRSSLLSLAFLFFFFPHSTIQLNGLKWKEKSLNCCIEHHHHMCRLFVTSTFENWIHFVYTLFKSNDIHRGFYFVFFLSLPLFFLMFVQCYNIHCFISFRCFV